MNKSKPEEDDDKQNKENKQVSYVTDTNKFKIFTEEIVKFI